MTNDKATITSRINAMVADGNTVIPEGLAWGWRLISPAAPFTEGSAYGQKDVIKVIILLTDGANDIGEGVSRISNGPFGTYFTAYGYKKIPASNNQLGADALTTLNNKTTQVCNNIKADKDGDPNTTDILLYTISFDVTAQSIKTLLQNCASDPSKYFNSPSTTDLATRVREHRGGAQPTEACALSFQTVAGAPAMGKRPLMRRNSVSRTSR